MLRSLVMDFCKHPHIRPPLAAACLPAGRWFAAARLAAPLVASPMRTSDAVKASGKETLL